MSTTDTTDREQPLYRDKDWLEVQIVEKGRSQQDIADECGVNQSTISTWKDKFEIQEEKGLALWTYPTILRKLYHEDGLSQQQIADKLGCSDFAVHENMKKLGIESDNPTWERPPAYRTNKGGYREWRHSRGGDTWQLYEHRLLAVAEFGFGAVRDMHVHHKNHMKLDNRPENLEIMTRSEHSSYHSNHPGFGHLETHQEQEQ